MDDDSPGEHFARVALGNSLRRFRAERQDAELEDPEEGDMSFNGKGLICSEMVAQDMKDCGWTPPEWFPEVPSPADLELALLGRRNAIEQ